MNAKKTVMIEIAAAFQSSFDSTFLSADEKVGKLKSKLDKFSAASQQAANLRVLGSETAKLAKTVEDTSAKLPDLKAAYEAATSAQDRHKQKTAELGAEVQRNQHALEETRIRQAKARSEVEKSTFELSARKAALSAAAAEEKDLTRALAAAEARLKSHAAAERANTAATDQAGHSIEVESTAIQDLRSEVDRLTRAREAARAGITMLDAETQQHQLLLQSQRSTLAGVKNEVAKLTVAHAASRLAANRHASAVKAEDKILADAGQSVKAHKERLNSAETAFKQASAALDANTFAIKNNKEALKQAGHEMGDLVKLEGELAKAKGRAARTHQLAERSGRLKDRRRELRSDMVSGAFETAGLAISLGAPIKIAADFEHAMAKVGAQTMASSDEMKLLEQTARKLGDTTIFSSSEAAQAESFLATAGFEVQEIVDSLEGVLNLAAAGDTGLAETAEIASNMLSSFALDATEMVRVANVMTATFISTNTDLRDLAETMKYVAPVAHGLKASIEEVAAASGLLGNVGTQGSMAGTALRAMYQRLAAPPAAGMAALQALGVSTKDAQKNLLPLPRILEQLNSKLAKMGTAERAKYIKDIFGEEAAAGATALLEKAGSGVLQFEIKKLHLAPAFRSSLKELANNLTPDDLKGLQDRFGIAFTEGMSKSERVAELGKAFKGLKGKEFDQRFEQVFKLAPRIDKNELDLTTDAAKKQLKALKISEIGSDKQNKSNDQLTKEIEAALAGMPEAKKMEAMSILFSKTRSSIRSLMQEASTGGDKFKNLTDALEKTNSAEEISERLNNTTIGAWKTLQSAIEAVAISAGGVFLPALAQVMKELATGALAVSGFLTENETLVKAFGFIAAALILNKALMVGYAAAMWVLNGAISIVTVAQKLLNMVMSRNPIGLIITAAMVLAPILYGVYKNFDVIKAAVTRLWGYLKAFFKGVWDFIEPVAQFTPLGFVIKNWEPILDFFTRLWEKLKPIFKSMGSFFAVGETRAIKMPAIETAAAGSSLASRLATMPHQSLQKSGISQSKNYSINQTFEIQVQGGDKAPDSVAREIKSKMVDGFKPGNFSFNDALGF